MTNPDAPDVEPCLERIDLAVDERAPAKARRFVQETAGGGKWVEEARLLVSELVSNVVRHTSGDRLTVGVATTDDGGLRVEVAHRGTAFRRVAFRDCAERVSGWGLEIVDRVARRWGVHGGDPTVVWFELGGAAA